MATLKHEKAKEDTHRKMVEESILEILALQKQILALLRPDKPSPVGKQKPIGSGRG